MLSEAEKIKLIQKKIRLPMEAVKELQRQAEQGNADAQCGLGACYYIGRGVPQDKAEAAKWYRKVAEHGDKKGEEALRRLEQ